MPKKNNPQEYFEFIKPVVRAVGEYLEKNRRNIHIVQSKRDKLDIQTDIDLGAEKIYLDAIHKKFPNHAIISEENQIPKDSDFVWYIDPLDCTKEFFRDIAIYNTNITLEFRGKSILSIIYRPADKEFYLCYAEKSYFNDKACIPSTVNSLAKSIVYLYLPHLGQGYTKSKFDRIFNVFKNIASHAYRVRALPDENSAMCWVAAGKCEAFVDLFNPNAHWWDWSGGISMVNNAGGKATDMFGKQISKESMQNGIVASNGHIHRELLNIIANS